MSLISELRRRQVFRAAAWYGGAAWLTVEVANTVFPQFGLPSWSVRAVIVAALLGLPVAVVLAWTYDLTSTGIRRDAPAGDVAPAAPIPFWRVPSLWIAVALGAGLALSAQQALQRLVKPAFEGRPGIAVLPFANLSPDPANAYFADGLHEEVLSALARVSGLRVVSRTSVQAYRDSKENIRDIANALDVALILEGSVRRVDDDLRLTLELIDGRNDEHLWTETYDRKFRDALRLQRTVAQQVVAAIGARLTANEKRFIDAASPTQTGAFEPYVHALALWNRWATDEEQEVVKQLLDQSLEVDPGFALAYALRAKVQIWRTQTVEIPNKAAMITLARSDIDRALALVPDLPEALAARGLYYTYVVRDPERGLDDLMAALSTAPNDPDSHSIAALTLRRLGRFDEAIEHMREAARLTPGQKRYAYSAYETLFRLGRVDEAEEEIRALAERFPQDPGWGLRRFDLRFLRSGTTDGWREEYERVARASPELRRSTGAGRRMMLATGDLRSLVKWIKDHEYADENDRRYDLALAYAALGDARAKPLLTQFADLPRGPHDAMGISDRAVALSLLDDHAAALRAADEAVRLAPESRDVVNGRLVAAKRAFVLIRSGSRADEGYAELDRLVGGFDMPPRLVAVDIPWRLLRDDARTQQIIRSKFPAG